MRETEHGERRSVPRQPQLRLFALQQRANPCRRRPVGEEDVGLGQDAEPGHGSAHAAVVQQRQAHGVVLGHLPLPQFGQHGRDGGACRGHGRSRRDFGAHGGRGSILPLGRGRILREGGPIAILSFGARLAEALKAAEDLAARGLPATVADARFAKPLDEDLVRRLAAEHEVLITIEEGSISGFASQVMQFLATAGLFDAGLRIRPMILPDRFVEHDSPVKQYEDAGLAARNIVATALAALGGQTSTRPALA